MRGRRGHLRGTWGFMMSFSRDRSNETSFNGQQKGAFPTGVKGKVGRLANQTRSATASVTAKKKPSVKSRASRQRGPGEEQVQELGKEHRNVERASHCP